MSRWIVVSSLLAIGLAGCASTALDEKEVARNERQYVTGSNIARRPDQPNQAPVQSRSGDDIRSRPGNLPEFIGAPEGYRGGGG